MKNAKLRHILLVAVLLALTAVILFVVAAIRWPGRICTLPGFSSTQAVSESLPTEAVTEAPSETETATEPAWLPEIEYDDYTPSEIAQEAFRSTVILGNSQAQALSNFGLIRDADYVTRVGLSINQVLTSKTGDPPIVQLYGKQYSKAVFVFGENELGWPYPKNFIAIYKKVIAKVRELNPGIEVYCQAIFPVTAEHSASSTTGTNNENVRIFNGLVEEMCNEIGATFMPASDAFFDRDGALPADAATDGVHFGYDYCKIWAGDMSAYIQPDAAETTESAEATEPTKPDAIEEPKETTEEGVTQE